MCVHLTAVCIQEGISLNCLDKQPRRFKVVKRKRTLNNRIFTGLSKTQVTHSSPLNESTDVSTFNSLLASGSAISSTAMTSGSFVVFNDFTAIIGPQEVTEVTQLPQIKSTKRHLTCIEQNIEPARKRRRPKKAEKALIYCICRDVNYG